MRRCDYLCGEKKHATNLQKRRKSGKFAQVLTNVATERKKISGGFKTIQFSMRLCLNIRSDPNITPLPNAWNFDSNSNVAGRIIWEESLSRKMLGFILDPPPPLEREGTVCRGALGARGVELDVEDADQERVVTLRDQAPG